MGKIEKSFTVYTCDRCGKLIYDSAKPVTRHVYIRVMRWFVPVLCQYKLTYLCKDCFEGLKEYLKPKEDDHAQNGQI